MSPHPYQTRAYADAFAKQGYTPAPLPSARTHALLRPIPGTSQVDALGVYPLCPMDASADLASDFESLRKNGAVSLVLVTDPFTSPARDVLDAAFDRVADFKEHFLCDLRIDHTFSKHHRYEVRRAHKDCETRVVNLADHLDEWYGLYSTLIEKHGMGGIQAFPKDYFAALIALEPLMVAAFAGGRMLSAHLWFSHGKHAYSHLAASSEEGYKLRGSYAVYDVSITELKARGIEVVDLGGGAGTTASAGLTFLKQGFSNASVMCYLASKVLDEAAYAKLSEGKTTNFFPAYRAP